MYTLTLTAPERKAIDFVGGRYWHGHDLYRILWTECKQSPNDVDWDSEDDIQFLIPEHIAWDIDRAASEDNYQFDLFGGELFDKLLTLCGQIV